MSRLDTLTENVVARAVGVAISALTILLAFIIWLAFLAALVSEVF
jgi:hypothetical protein